MGTVQNIMGVLYSCTTFLGMFNMMSVMPILGYERSVMYRSVLLLDSSSSSSCSSLVSSSSSASFCSAAPPHGEYGTAQMPFPAA